MNKKIIIVVISCLFFAGTVVFAQNKHIKDTTLGTTVRVVKEIIYIPSNGKEITQKAPGQALFVEDKVQTGKGCLAIVRFLDKSTLVVQENSLLKIFGTKSGSGKNAGIKSNTIVNEGKAFFKVEKQNSNGDFKFTTPTMVASIRGTEGLISAISDTASTLAVTEGLVYVEAVGGSKESGNIPAGKTATVNKSGKLTTSTISNEMKLEIEKAQDTDIKKMIIKTTKGDFIIEYK